MMKEEKDREKLQTSISSNSSFNECHSLNTDVNGLFSSTIARNLNILKLNSLN